MRQAIKSVSSKELKFIPTKYKEDPELSEDAKEIKNRPIIIKGRRLGREDRYNISSLQDTKKKDGKVVISNVGTVAKYIWNNCATEVLNVLTDEGGIESMKGQEKDALFDAEGMEEEIAEFVKFVNEQSYFDESEVKN